MRLDTSQQLKLAQEMRLSPRLIQAMEILQLPLLALQERIDAELVSNPVLEVQEPGSGEEYSASEMQDSAAFDHDDSVMIVNDGGNNADDFNRLDEMSREFGEEAFSESMPMTYQFSGDGEAGQRKLEAMANTAAPSESLNEYLHSQWRFTDAPDDVKQAGEWIIDYIESDGYVRTPLDDILHAGLSKLATDEGDQTGQQESPAEPAINHDTMRHALALIQGLDPLGVGARDVRECLLIQLHAAAQNGRDVTLEWQVVANHLKDVEMNHLPVIAKKLNVTIEDVKDAIGRLANLDPRPGLQVGQPDTPTITPDVIVEVGDEGQIIVVLADDHVPQLMVNEYYAQQASDKMTERATKQFLQKNIRSAQWLMDAIAQRRRTIRRVAEEVFKVQRDFFDAGPEALKPLPMADVAEKVGVHVATVSRAVSDKYAQTPRGIFPLRMFFTSGRKTASGEEMSWDAVKVRLKEIIDNENKSKPLSDDKLEKMLQSEGIDIKRRTIAKYRDQMGIPTARKRKQY